MIVGATYFATIAKADFPGADTIRDLTGSVARLYTQRSDGPRSISEIVKETTQQVASPSIQINLVPTLQAQDPSISTSTPQLNPGNKLEKLANAPWMNQKHGDTYEAVENLPWVKDGLSDQEIEVVEDFFYIAVENHANLQTLMKLNWLQDTISNDEAQAISQIQYLDNEAARRVINMPFLKSIVTTDVLALRGLNYQEQIGSLNTILNHPDLADGITDDDTTLVTAATASNNIQQINLILKPGGATIKYARGSTQRTPRLSISIVRAGNRKAPDTSDIIKEAVEYVENTMNLPLPTNHVILLLDDTGVTPGYAGTNYGQAIAYLRKGEDGTDWDNAAFRAGMVHEVAHYFWRGSETWIDEGVADTIEHNYVRDMRLPNEMLISQRDECSLNTLQELSAIGPKPGDPHHKCSYYLGQRLFLELQNLEGKQEFTNRLIALYNMSHSIQENDEEAGLAEVQAVFLNQPDIIAKHWTGKVPDTVTTSRPTPTRPLITTNPPLASIIANINPTPIPNIQSIIQRPTTTPRIQNATQTPAPTPAPTPIPQITHEDQDPAHGYRIILPKGWTLIQKGKEATFRSPDRTGKIRISVREFSKEMDERGFARNVRQEAIDTHAHKDDHFDIYAWEEQFTKEAQWQQKFTWTLWSAEDSCVQTRTDVIFRSRYFPSRPKAYVLTLSACSERFTQHIANWENSLESFTEVIPKT